MCCAKLPNAEEKPYYETLPHSLKPHHYEVSISEIDLVQNSFKGRVVIHLKVNEETDELHLNYRDLSIGKVTIETENGKQDVVDIEHFKEKEFFVAKLPAPVKGPSIKATVEYDGVIQTNMAGFYKSSYVDNGVEKQMVSTQFEATDARRAFPCFDEPSEKATFDVEIQLRNDWTALSNTPVKSATSEGDAKKVVFETTPVMSTYLLAWACGDFEYIESFTEETKVDHKPIPVRIYTTKGGYLKDAKLASKIAPKILDYFSKVFEVKYPLPKLDLIAVHAFSHNAMENWGLITYRSTALLFSEEDSDPAYKQKVAYVIAHELAHQWFGNLVTMKWWDELWLNEGFATWVGWYAVDYLFPEWDVFSGFVSEVVQQALTLDGLRNSHPIEVPVIDALDIDQLFDAISYLKGASVIHMISNYLGTETFLKGVAKYLNANKFGNATSSDLWGAISDVSGKPLGQLMDAWIKKVGYPIINVDIDEASNSLVLTQARFLNGGDVKPEENETKWWIPLNISTDSTSLRELSVDSFESETLIVDNFPLSNDFFKFNKNTSSAYRVNYSSTILEKNILPYIKKMSSKDRVGLIADVASIAVSGISSSTSLLKLARIIAETPELDNDYVTWLELGVRLNQLMKAFAVEGDDELTAELISFEKSIYQKQAVKIIDLLRSGKADKQDFVAVKLRKNILEHVSVLGIKEVQEYAFEVFDQWVKEGKVGDASIRSFVFNSVVSSPEFSREQYGFILKEVTEPSSLDAAEVTLGSLGTVTNPELAKEIISLITNTDVVQSMNTHFLAVPLSINRTTKNQLWQFVSANYSDIYKNLSSNMVVLDRFIKSTLANYQSTEKLDEITQFFKGKDTHGFERGFNQALDNIKIKSSWYERDHQELLKFLQTNK